MPLTINGCDEGYTDTSTSAYLNAGDVLGGTSDTLVSLDLSICVPDAAWIASEVKQGVADELMWAERRSSGDSTLLMLVLFAQAILIGLQLWPRVKRK